jgi:hypothetical protein
MAAYTALELVYYDEAPGDLFHFALLAVRSKRPRNLRCWLCRTMSRRVSASRTISDEMCMGETAVLKQAWVWDLANRVDAASSCSLITLMRGGEQGLL